MMESVARDYKLNSLELQELTISFPNQPPTIKNCSLNFQKGKTYLLTGATASGKSTLLRFLKGIVPLFYPATILGEIRVNGKSISLEEFWEHRTEIGYLFQDPPIQVIGASVEKDLAFGLENLAINSSEMKQQIEEIAKRLNISHLMSQPTTELSGGELALVALASILVLQPKILLLDEFTAFLDNQSRKRVFDTIRLIQGGDRIIIIVSHQLQNVLPLVDEVIVLDDGQVLLQTSKQGFFTSSFSIIKDKLRVPEIIHIGVTLCEKNELSPDFETEDELFQLIGR